jgi:hypothetical protein
MEPIQSFVQPSVWTPELTRGASDQFSAQAPLVVFEHRSAPTIHGPSAGYKFKTEQPAHRMYYQYDAAQRQNMAAYRPQQEQTLWNSPQIPERLTAYMQGPFQLEDAIPRAPTSPEEHVSIMPTGVYDEESSAPAPPLRAHLQPLFANERPVDRRRASKKMSPVDISASFTEASLQAAVRRLAPQAQRPASDSATARVVASPDRSKRGRVRTNLDFALMHKGAPLPKAPLLPAAVPTAVPLSPAKPSPPKRRKLAVPQPPAAVSAASAPGALAPASVRQAISGASATAGIGSSVLLSTCKFVSKRTCVECPDVPRSATHKRGYLACACSQGHQWVWCAKCCACPRPAGAKGRGCNNAAHWFERDAFDTGRRNHMNRHQEK